MRSQSLPVRLAVSSLLVALVTSGLLVLGMQLLLLRANQATVRTRLDDRATAVAAGVRATSHGIEVLGSGSALVEQGSWVFDADGTLRAGRLSGSDDRVSEEVRELGRVTSERRVTDDDVTFLARPVVRNGVRVATVVASEDLQPYEDSQVHSLWLGGALAGTSILLATVAAWMAARRSLRRVQTMADTADEWREHDQGARFDLGPGGDEISHLGRTLDRMLDRIADALSAERRLTDEIAHELRNPLSVVLAEADLGRNDPEPTRRESFEAIRAAALQMRSAIDTILTAARAHADHERGYRLGDLMAELGRPPTRYDELQMVSPTPLLVAALRPLLENAERHAGAPGRLEVALDDGHVVVSVVDDGPGVPADDVERVFEPGQSTRPGSAGLGLALARRMATAAGAVLVAKPGPGGRFELRVPLQRE
ncbi:MAG TPA: HAMP domain-containing sensor histidine kinase [Nocardioides sp.]|nr:HAMP domain-containing sensor histidine kinase [Nocardioides sp.]